MSIRSRRRNRNRQNTAVAAPSTPKVESKNAPRVAKTQGGAEEVAQDNIIELGKDAQVKSPAELTQMIRAAAADGSYTAEEAANVDLQLAGLIAVGQEAHVSEVAFLAGKAKEARLVAMETREKLELAGLYPKGDMWEQLRRGSFFLGNGRRMDVTALLASLALVKSAVLIPRRNGEEALKERLFADVPPMLIPQFQKQMAFQSGTHEVIAVDGISSYSEVACTTKYDEKTMSHVIYYAVDPAAVFDATAFKGDPSMPAVLTPASFFGPTGPIQTGMVCRAIKDIWPTIKDGDRFPLNWVDTGTYAGFDIASNMVVPIPSTPNPITVKIDEAAHAFDTQAVLKIGTGLGLTHLINHPLVSVAGLAQGTIEGLLKLGGTVDLSTASR